MFLNFLAVQLAQYPAILVLYHPKGKGEKGKGLTS